MIQVNPNWEQHTCLDNRNEMQKIVKMSLSECV